MSESTKDNDLSSATNVPAPIEIKEADKRVLPTRAELLSADRLTQGIIDGSNTFDLIDMILAEMAEDCVHLKYERLKKENNDEAVDRLVLRHANILKMISDSLVQKRNLALNDIVNLKSPQWQLVFEELLKKVKQTLLDVSLSSEQIELFFERLNKNLEGFEEHAEIRLRESLNTAG